MFKPPDFQMYKSMTGLAIRDNDIYRIRDFYIREMKSISRDDIPDWFAWLEDLNEIDIKKIGLKLTVVEDIMEFRTFEFGIDNYYMIISKQLLIDEKQFLYYTISERVIYKDIEETPHVII